MNEARDRVTTENRNLNELRDALYARETKGENVDREFDKVGARQRIANLAMDLNFQHPVRSLAEQISDRVPRGEQCAVRALLGV